MTKKKESRLSIHLNDKARLYMEEMNYLDKNTGRKKKSGPSINDFLNQVIIDVFERNGDSAYVSWINWRLQQLAKQHNGLYVEIDRLREEKHSVESKVLKIRQENMLGGGL